MIQQVPKDSGPTETKVSADPPPAVDDLSNDPRYFRLSKPIKVGEKQFDRLLIDSSELSGAVYFNLVGRFRKECNEVYRSSTNKLAEEMFLSYIVAELNPPMVVEDLRKLPFNDLPILFIQLQAFLFSARMQSNPTPTTTQ
jgi:hypothetical protein